MRKPSDPPKYTWNGNPVNQFANLSSYAEKMLVHENAVVKIEKNFPLDRAAKIEPGSTVAVFGTGGVGLAAIQGARIAGARQIIAVDVMEHKLARARELGATHSVDASSQDPVKAIRDMTG